jgi:hypothetical protein
VLAQELEPIEREILVKAAILATSMRDTQPWRFRFRHHIVEMHRELDQDLCVLDPDGRMSTIAIGAAAFNIRVAAASLGRRTSMAVLPDPDHPDMVAEVGIESSIIDIAADVAEPARLFPYLSRLRGGQRHASPRPIPATVREELAQAATVEGAVLEWIDNDARTRWLLAVGSDSERVHDRVVAAETGEHPARETAPDTEGRPSTLAVVWTPHDDPQSWFLAGQAMQRVLLVATTYGLAGSMLDYPLEHADLRWLVRERRSGWIEPQVVLRFGYGPEAPSAPRRHAAEFVLDNDEGMGPAMPAQRTPRSVLPRKGR